VSERKKSKMPGIVCLRDANISTQHKNDKKVNTVKSNITETEMSVTEKKRNDNSWCRHMCQKTFDIVRDKKNV
jgi:hypothetical protein